VPKQPVPAPIWEETEPSRLAQLAVNVLFTDARATRTPLEAATRLAKTLEASIRVRAVMVVPFSLPLDRPQFSIPFLEEALSRLVTPFQQNSLDITAHLYLSRNRIATLLQVLQSNALVIRAGRKRPWPTAESRMAKRLQVKGHGVVVLPLRKGD
jgi:hypothetical protein